jgi:hypothetical protein
MTAQREILRSGYTAGGASLYLVWRAEEARYRVETNFGWLAAFVHLDDASDAFEVLLMEETGDRVDTARLVYREIQRIAGRTFNPASARIPYLSRCLEHRQAGRKLRTLKGHTEVWV